MVNAASGEPDYNKYPSLVEYVSAYQTHQLPNKHLILKGGQGVEADVFANSITTDLMDEGETIKEIKHVRDCDTCLWKYR